MEAAAYSQERFLPLFGKYLGVDLDSSDVQLIVNNYFKSIPIQGAFLRSSGQQAIIRRYEKLINTGELLQTEIKSKVGNQ